MKPVLFEFLGLTVHAYGLLIVLGAYAGYFFMAKHAKAQFGIAPEKISTLVLIIAVAAFVGGKLFFYFEDPVHYFGNPSNMLKNIGSGFVFFGSLLLAVPATMIYFRKQGWPIIPMLDLIAITAAIVHAFGRMGCLLAGCCYGLPTDAWFGITFTDPQSQAHPLHTSLHPTQIYSMVLLVSLVFILNVLRTQKQFHGQVFLVYIMVYSIGRSIIEVFRGDEARGFILGDWYSHSQLISTLVFLTALSLYAIWRKRPNLQVSSH